MQPCRREVILVAGHTCAMMGQVKTMLLVLDQRIADLCVTATKAMAVVQGLMR